jgi:heat shock protein HslJ
MRKTGMAILGAVVVTAVILIILFVQSTTKEKLPIDLNNTSWQLITFGVADSQLPPVEDAEITLNFEENNINGMVCNNYFGNYTLSGKDIRVTSLGSTEMFCTSPEGLMEQESDFLVMLGNIRNVEIDGGNLRLTGENGETMIFN